MSILAVLALCLTMLPMAAFAVDPFEGYEMGDTVKLDGKEYTYLGDVTETGLAVGEWEVDMYGPAGIAKAGEGYVSYQVEDGIAYITVCNATISSQGDGMLEGYGILVVDYDAHITGVGDNVIQAADTAINVTGCLTLDGEFQRIAGENTGILCMVEVGFGDEEVSTFGGDAMINANIGEVVGAENVGLYIQGNLIINGKLDDVSGGTAIDAGDGLTINGTIGAVKGYMVSGIAGRGDVVIGKDAVIGEIEADIYGIYVDCITDEDGTPLADASLTIQGQVGPIKASLIQEDVEGAEDWFRFGIFVSGGDVVIAEGASVVSVYGDTYGAWVEGGELIVKGSVPGGITGGEQDIYTEEWPSFWAHVEVMDAILFDLVPADLQCKYTQATTRAEYCALATCLYEAVTGGPIELTEEDVLPFTDVEQDENIAKMYKIGVVNGMGDGTFAPNAQLTREQAAAMLSRLAEAVGEPLAASEPDFTDKDQIFPYAYEAVGQVQAAGIMQGMGDGTFAPKGSYTREQSILTMDRLFNMVFWDE